MGGAWETLTRVCHVLNLSLSPIWLPLLFCLSDNLWGWEGAARGKQILLVTRLTVQLRPSARPQSRSLTWVQGASENVLAGCGDSLLV